MNINKHNTNLQPLQNHQVQLQAVADKFICPVCKHKASIYISVVKCSNIKCGIDFPIIKNIPILINEEESIFSISNFINTKENIISFKERVKKVLQPFFPSLSNNLSSKKNFKLLEKLLSQKIKPKILILGGATITTNTEMIFNANNIVIESDIYIGPRTQIVIDSHHIPFEAGTFDLVIFQAVLEYVADPYQCVMEAHRVLNSDGVVFASTPFMQHALTGTVDFTRFTHLGHRRLFRAFNEIESGVFAGTGVALGWSIRVFVGSIVDNKHIKLLLQMLVHLLFFWLKYIDYFIYRNKGTFEGASGFYFIGRKSDKILSDKELLKFHKGI